MRNLLLVLIFIGINKTAFSQEIQDLDGKWAFSGSRTTLFTVKNDSLFLSLIDDHHSIPEFEQLYSGKVNPDSLTLFPCKTTQFGDKLMIVAEIEHMNVRSLMSFMYSTKKSASIMYIGDVYYNDKRVPNANENCNLQIPYCENRLYTLKDMETIKTLKSITQISKKEVLLLFEKHSKLVLTKCNKCYEGFPGADINGILIEMGYNPIKKIKWNDSYAYQSSGFDNIVDIYREDKEIEDAYKGYFIKYMENKN